MSANPTKTRKQERSATADTTAIQPQLETDLAELHDLLQRADLKGARVLIEQLADRWPDSDRVRHLARVLAPPVVTTRPGKPGHSRARERAWLRDYGRDYAGQWLALHGDQLIAADADLAAVLAVVQARPEGKDALLHYEPGPSD